MLFSNMQINCSYNIFLATMKWWNDLWLNEGFATYMKFKGVKCVHPDWDVVRI
jgi:hypothetical protein